MSTKKATGSENKTSASISTNLIAGGGAGMMEALVCHPLDTIKVRMQLSKRRRAPGVRPRGFILTGKEIVRKESFFALYKGLGAVMTGIVPKMAIRFTSYEWYKQLLASKDGIVSTGGIFFALDAETSGTWSDFSLAGLSAGITEAVFVVTPMEVVKIRLQAQYHSMADPLDIPKYRNAGHACLLILREEGLLTLYRGVTLTALRQGTNQAVNFSVYTQLKSLLKEAQPKFDGGELPSYQTATAGLISGAMGPFCNAPIDTIKTRLQKGEGGGHGGNAFKRIQMITREMYKTEGLKALYKGITPRVMRVAPGQAVTFTVYEYLKGLIENSQWSLGREKAGKFEE